MRHAFARRLVSPDDVSDLIVTLKTLCTLLEALCWQQLANGPVWAIDPTVGHARIAE